MTRAAPPRQERAKHTLRRVLGAAEQAIARNGLDGLDLRKICARAGVTTGALYARFDSKSALLNAVFDGLKEESERIIAEYLADARRGAHANAADAVSAFNRALERVYDTRGALISALIAGSHGEPALRRRAIALMDAATIALGEAVARSGGAERSPDRARAAVRLAFAWFDHALFAARCRAAPIDRDLGRRCLDAAVLAALRATA